jgi:hypothetical protein
METHNPVLAMTEFYDEKALRQKRENGRTIVLEHLKAFYCNECNIAVPYCKLYVRSIITEHDLRFDETQRIGQDRLFVAEYLQLTQKAVYTDKKTYRYRMAPASTTSKRHDLATQLLSETASNKMVTIYERVAPERVYRMLMQLIIIMVAITVTYLRNGQKVEAKEYLRKARAIAWRICRDRYAPASFKLKALLKVYFYRLFDVYTLVVRVKRPQAINWLKERKAVMRKDRGERCPR